MWYRSILETVGKTPLVALSKIYGNRPGTLLAKVEYFNPGQSVKDRIALKMVEEAEKTGLLKPGGTIVEGTSGNTGMGLALAAAVKGYRCIFTTTDKQSMEKVNLLRALGSEVHICPTNVAPDDPRSYYSVAKKLSEQIPGAWYPNQYDNLDNRKAHYETTGPEIWEQTEGRVTHFVAGMGTGGTLSGVAAYLLEQNPHIRIIGVDSVGSVYKSYFQTGVFDARHVAPYLTEGIGEDIIPANVDFSLVHDVIQCPDREAFQTTRLLARSEGVFAGGSCGAAVWGCLKYLEQHPPAENDVIVVLLPDSGTRYVSKIYNDEWMRRNGFLEEPQTLEAGQLIRERNDNKAELVVTSSDETLEQAIARMNSHGISQLPVLQAGELVGSLTESRILNVLSQPGTAASMRVAEVMDQPFPEVSEDSRIEEVTRLFSGGAAAVMVRRRNGERRIVTRSDVITAITKTADKTV